MFAVDRIRSLAVTNHPCQLPLGFDVEAYVRDALTVLRVADTPELVGWILSFGPGVRVLRPNPLRRQILSTAAEIAKQD
jgi:predicted DNA-binding transcriptional regulator YafY